MWPDKGLPVRCGRCCWVPAHRGTQEERWVSISTEEPSDKTTRAWWFWKPSTPPGGKDAQIKSYTVRRMCLKEKQRVWTQKDGNFRTLTHMGEPRDPPCPAGGPLSSVNALDQGSRRRDLWVQHFSDGVNPPKAAEGSEKNYFYQKHCELRLTGTRNENEGR